MHPDAVLNGGDLIVTKGTHAKTDRSLSLIKELVSRYPVYCGEGNHENRIDWEPGKYGSEGNIYRNALKPVSYTHLTVPDLMLILGSVQNDMDYIRSVLLLDIR